jgi:ElaB/YqjD/DUF883 family membrane-anchored ribosome-binding protein
MDMTKTRSAAGNGDANATPPNPTTERVAALAHETIDRVAETAKPAEHRVRSAAATAAEAAKRAQDQAVEAAGENLRKVRSYMEQNPLTTAGVAFAAGALLVGWLRR